MDSIERVCLAVDLNSIQNETLMDLSEVPDYMFDRRYAAYCSNNCVSILLFL